MLNAYRVLFYISIDNKPQKRIFRIGYGLTEDELPKVVTTSWSFQDCLDNKVQIPDIKTDTTIFRHRPYVEVDYAWDHTDRYYNFDSITIEQHYEPYDITLDTLFRDYSADKCIQYLKERGMNMCPILK